MDNKTLQVIISGPSAECLVALTEFNNIHEKNKDFKEIDRKTKEQLWDALFSRMKPQNVDGDEEDRIVQSCLHSLRILSRDKDTLEKVMTEDRVTTLLALSGLYLPHDELKPSDNNTKAKKVAGPKDRPKSVEGLKAIFNMVFQSQTLQVMFMTDGILTHLIKRIEDFTSFSNGGSSNLEYPHEFQYFVGRILFLITALCQDIAPAKVRNSLNGLPILASYLESKMESIICPSTTTNNFDNFDNLAADIVCEILKVLYNLISDMIPKTKKSESFESEIDREDLEQLKRITCATRILLLNTTNPNFTISGNLIEVESKKQDIRRHSIDLLAAVPAPCFDEFVPMIATGSQQQQSTSFAASYLEHDMTAVEATLLYLNEKLDAVKQSSISTDYIAPPLLALHNMSIGHRAIRKYLKKRILPPLKRKDVENLPEEGKTIRNKLVALLTSPITHITDLVANLLFILCKEKVGKLVKYTGYGNAAGLLANKGLMLGGQGPPPGKYSDSDSDDGSDLDEYREVEHMINHIEGRIHQDRPDPMEGMTDEQKEHEAMKLIRAIDKMDRCSGGIRPCRIGADGRPEPIQHVLQLQEALENPLKGLRRDDTDSDSD
ncbi:synembryn-A [Folsomia candida]|nr:synembryn-A [Folsomia candida]XP_035709842.1 synembryn-A [Folsomia candida]XP_035709843.1 synembryn-A [Folsomia candida]